MKTINKINYEQFAIDYLEGNLSGGLLLEMKEFLNNHPDIKEELDGMELFYLEADDHVFFEGKNTLLQSTSPEKGFSIRPLFWISGIAACFILITGLFVINYNTNPSMNNIANEKEINNNTVKNNIANTTNNAINPIKNTEDLVTKEKIIAKKPIQKTNTVQEKTIANPPKENLIHNNNTPIAFSKPKPQLLPQQHDNQPNKIIFSNKNDKKNPIANQTIPEIKNDNFRQKNNIELKPLVLESIALGNNEIILENNLTVVNPQEKSRLRKMGFLPEKSNRKITLKTIREALIPEGFASKD